MGPFAFSQGRARNLRTLDFAGTEATGADINGCVGTAYHCLYLADVRLPGSVSLAMRVGHGVAENHAFTANAALCHLKHLLIWSCARERNLCFLFHTNGQRIL